MPEIDKTKYKKGDKTEVGSEIASILGATKDIVVLLTVNGNLAWETNDKAYTNPRFSELLSILDRERGRIAACVVIKKVKFRLKAHLGSAFYNCVRDPNDTTAVQRLQKQIKELEADIGFHLRAFYLALAFISSTVLGGVFVATFIYTRDPLWLSLSGGVLGVFLSILFSPQRIQVTGRSTAVRQLIDSQVRIIYGCLCGMVAYIFSKAGVVGSVFANADYGTMTFSIIAGFSERFVPSLISELESKGHD